MSVWDVCCQSAEFYGSQGAVSVSPHHQMFLLRISARALILLCSLCCAARVCCCSVCVLCSYLHSNRMTDTIPAALTNFSSLVGL